VLRAAVAAAVVLLVAGAARAQEWKPPDAPEIAVLAAAELLIVVDVLQTAGAVRTGRLTIESNPFLGQHPTEARVYLVGGAVPMALTAGVWLALPSRVRIIAPAVVAILEALVIADNARQGLSPTAAISFRF
jgi:hypothetical protein